MFLTLLLQLPGVEQGLPGISQAYIPTQAAQQYLELYERVRLASLGLIGLIFMVSCAIHAFSILGKMQVNPHDVWQRGLLSVALLLLFPFIHFWVYSLNHAVAQVFFTDSDMSALNEEFRTAANEQLDADAAANGGDSWFKTLALAVSILNPAQALLTELLMGLATVLFYVSTILMAILWRLLVGMLYVTAPLLIVMGGIPRLGGRIQGAWICTTIQVAFWQVWMSITAFMVRTSDSYFQPQIDLLTGNGIHVVNHYESIATALGFACFTWMGPFFIAILLPISKASTTFGFAYMAMTNTAISMGSKALQVASGGAGKAVGGAAGGAAGGRMSTGKGGKKTP